MRDISVVGVPRPDAYVLPAVHDGSYGEGGAVVAAVQFREPAVYSGPDPVLWLNMSGSPRAAPFQGGNDTSRFLFNYTVQAGDNAADLGYYGAAGALSGAITTRTGGYVNLTLPSIDTLALLRDIEVDTPPIVESVSSPNASRTYVAGESIRVNVTFSEAVTVDATSGLPFVRIEAGAANRSAAYDSGNGTKSLLFAYAVRHGDNTGGLGHGRGALALNGSVIEDGTGNAAANLTLPAPGSPGSLSGSAAIVLDTEGPRALSVSSPNSTGSPHGIGDTLRVEVVFDEAVLVDTALGEPALALALGAGGRAVYAPAAGAGAPQPSASMPFEYAVGEGDWSARLDYAGESALSLNGSVVRDEHGNERRIVPLPPPGESSLAGTSGVAVDGVRPAVESVSSPNSTGSPHGIGDTIHIRVVFDEDVNATGPISLRLDAGGEEGSDRRAAYVPDSAAGDSLLFAYTVMEGDASAGLDYANRSALRLDGGGTAAIRDVAGNAATNLTLPAPGSDRSLAGTSGVAVDGVRPAVESVSSPNSTGSPHGIGDTIHVSVAFSEAVNATGRISLWLDAGGEGEDRRAAYVPDSAAGDSLLFAYTVMEGDASAGLDYANRSALRLDGGGAAIRDTAGNAANLTLPPTGSARSLAGMSAIAVNGTPVGGTGGGTGVPDTGGGTGVPDTGGGTGVPDTGGGGAAAETCGATLGSPWIKFGRIAAGSQSGIWSQLINGSGMLPFGNVTIQATEWSRSDGSGGFAMHPNATQFRTGGAGAEWTPLSREPSAAFGGGERSAPVEFQLVVPADALRAAGPGAVPVQQNVTYTVSCAEAPW